MSDLNDRIATALRGEPTSAEVEALITEARDALRVLDREHATAKDITLDPLASAAEVTKARKVCADLAPQGERLTVALSHLLRALEGARHREEQARRVPAYEALKARRDALVQELRTEYPKLAGALVDLLERMQACEAEIAQLPLPEGLPRLEPVEAEARGIPSNFYVGVSPVGRLAAGVRLPVFDGAEAATQQQPLWPNSALRIDLGPSVLHIAEGHRARRTA